MPEDRDKLTPREFQVASIVIEGATNSETAARIFVSSRTVDAQVQSIFRKLGIRDRKEVAEALERIRATPPDDPDDPD